MLTTHEDIRLAVTLLIVAMMGQLRGGEALTAPGQPVACLPAQIGMHMVTAQCTSGNLPFRLGYVPQEVSLPRGQRVLAEPDGECSGIPEALFGFDFHAACQMHDFGYDLIRVDWVDPDAQEAIDRAFLNAMLDGTCSQAESLRRGICGALAHMIWFVASLTPAPRIPDAGSFSRPS